MLVDGVEDGTSARGDYALLEVMGDPGSEVFRARTRSGSSVVLRFWRAGSELETNSAIELLERAIRVQHAMLARVHRCERFADGSLRVVSEYVPGRSLDAWVGEIGLPPLSIGIDFVRRLSLALADAHRVGVTHHALYPGNIVVLEPETHPHGRIAAKLLDLGIARYMRESTRFEAAHFVAPEALAHELESTARAPHVDARMNVYSCGCLLHYLATGQPPYQSDSLENLIALHASGRPALPARLNPRIPEELERVICQALALDPGRRIPDLASLARALSHVESQWRSSTVRRRTAPPPLPVRNESQAPPPSAAAGPRLAPAIAAALALRPVPKRISNPPAPPAQTHELTAPPPAAIASAPQPHVISLDASEVALLPADEPSPIDIPVATEAIVLEPAAAPEPAEVITAVLPGAEALAKELTADAQALEPPALAADAFEAITARTDLSAAASASSELIEPEVASIAAQDATATPAVASAAVALEAAPPALSTELASAAPEVDSSTAASVAAEVAPAFSEPPPCAEAVPPAVVTLPAIACAAAYDVASASPDASLPETNARGAHGPVESPHTAQQSAVRSESSFARNSLTPVEVAARRRSDAPPRLVTDVVKIPRVPALPRPRHWRSGAGAAAGAAVYWLVMTLSSSPEPSRQAIALPPTIVAAARPAEPMLVAGPAPQAPARVTPVVAPSVEPASEPPKRRAPQPSAATRPEQPQPVRREPPADPLDSLHVDLPPKPNEHVITGNAARVVRLEPVWSTPNVVAFSDSARPSAPLATGSVTVRTASIGVQGSLSIAQARRAIERISPQLRQCYVDSGHAGPTRLEVELIIDDVGRVRNLQVRGAVPSLTECVMQVSRKLMSGLPYTGAAKVAWNVSFE